MTNISDIIVSMGMTMERFMGNEISDSHVKAFVAGFSDGWNEIDRNLQDIMGLLNIREREFVQKMLEGDLNDIAKEFFPHRP